MVRLHGTKLCTCSQRFIAWNTLTVAYKLLQYVGLLNNLSDKFPFHLVYAYNKEFRVQLEWYPEKPWNVIDQQLLSTTLHGIHTLPHQGNPQQYTFKQKNRQTQSRTPPRGLDNQFHNCFDHNRRGCNCPSCSFPHVCGRCESLAHTTYNCPQKKTQPQQQTTATTPTTTRSNICPTKTPLKCRWLGELLQHHPDNNRVSYVLQGLQHGFVLEYDGPDGSYGFTSGACAQERLGWDKNNYAPQFSLWDIYKQFYWSGQSCNTILTFWWCHKTDHSAGQIFAG